jgi:DNA-binding beta-propeller fold protein YncE
MRATRLLLLGLAVLVGTGAIAATASAAEDPLWVFVPKPGNSLFEPKLPPPIGEINGPCGTTVDASGNFYISDYYHDAIDVYKPEGAEDFDYPEYKVKYAYKEGERPPLGKEGYITQIAAVDPIDGPCGLALASSGDLYVNDFHRSVIKYGSLSTSFGSGTVIAGQGVDSTHPTGVAVDQTTGNVYVDARTYLSVYDSSNNPVLDAGNPLHIGVGHIGDGYGVAVSAFPGTQGYLYVPDAASDTVKVFNPAASKVNPIDEIDGSETATGEFVSLRDSSVAVDRVTGEIYVVDNLHPKHAERPEAIVYIFNAAGTYEGHLLDRVVDNMPVGLAVDNSPSATYPAGTQGLVYVTSGNTARGAIDNYTPGAGTMAEPGPAAFAVKLSVGGSGEGSVQSSLRGQSCHSACEEAVPAGATVDLTAAPRAGSSFSGWSGACTGTDPVCSIQVEEAASVRADFARGSGSGPIAGEPTASPGQAAAGVEQSLRPRHRHRHRKHTRPHRGHRHR